MGFGIMMTKTLKMLRMTRLRRQLLLQALLEQREGKGASNKCTFSKVSQKDFCKLLFSQAFTHFRKYGFSVFCTVSNLQFHKVL